MAANSSKSSWRAEFFASAAATLSDSRLWLIVIPSLVLTGLTLAFLKPWLGGAIGVAIALVDAHLLNRIESLPRPDGKGLATSFYRTILLPSTIGAFVIGSTDLFAHLWFMPRHWFYTSGETPSCSYLVSGALLGWLGVPVTAAVTALLTRERAAFATMVGLMVYIPLNLTDVFSGDQVQKAASLMAKSCQLDLGGDASNGAYLEGFGDGMIAATIAHVLIAIFVARVVSTWLSLRSTPPLVR